MNKTREKSDFYAINEGYTLEIYLFECIRNGNRAGIEKEICTPKYKRQMLEIYGSDLSFLLNSCMFFWPQIARVAIEAGVSERVAVAIYDKFYPSTQLLCQQSSKSVEKMLELNTQLILKYASAVAAIKGETRFSQLVHRCRAYINEHVNQRINIEMIAEALNFSASYLSHAYKAETGETLYTRIKKEKIERAKLLLRKPGFSLTEIAISLGYSSQSHFINFFRKATGMTPSKYRSNASQKWTVEKVGDIPPCSSRDADYTVMWGWFNNYAKNVGISLMNYILYCIKEKRPDELQAILEDTVLVEKLFEEVGDKLKYILSAVHYLWPQAAGAARDGGLEEQAVSYIYIRYIEQLDRCATVGEVLALNRELLLEYANTVSNIYGDNL